MKSQYGHLNKTRTETTAADTVCGGESHKVPPLDEEIQETDGRREKDNQWMRLSTGYPVPGGQL